MKTFFTSTAIPDLVFGDTPDGQTVAIDFEELAGQHTLVAAQTGFGKSVLLRKSVEIALGAGFPAMIFDTDGGWASVRDVAPNDILVVGGDAGDPGITLESAIRRLSDLVAARASIVFDLVSLSDEDRASFVSRVLTALMRLPEALHIPRFVVIDEVQRFVPQRGITKATDAVIKAAKESRKQGLSLIVATQRLPDVSSALTSQTLNKLFGYVSEAGDRKRVALELGVKPSDAHFLNTFEKGDFHVIGVRQPECRGQGSTAAHGQGWQVASVGAARGSGSSSRRGARAVRQRCRQNG